MEEKRAYDDKCVGCDYIDECNPFYTGCVKKAHHSSKSKR